MQHLGSRVKEGWVALGKPWRRQSAPSFREAQRVLHKSVSRTLTTTPCVRKGVIVEVSSSLIYRWRTWVIKKHGANFPVSTSQLAFKSVAVWTPEPGSVPWETMQPSHCPPVSLLECVTSQKQWGFTFTATGYCGHSESPLLAFPLAWTLPPTPC